VKSSVDSRPLHSKWKPGVSLSKNSKKEAIQENRFTEIERENRILLEKMSQIMSNNKH
jgi:hypothetical protein